MTADVDVTANARHRLVETLIDKGALSTSEWFAVFRTVPRHAFVSRFSLLGRDGSNEHYDLDDPDRRDASMAAVYADQTLITRWDEGGAPISSSSTPSLMATMLEALDVHPGHRVLEIGTGTGYNAALLAHRLGNSAITPSISTRNWSTRLTPPCGGADTGRPSSAETVRPDTATTRPTIGLSRPAECPASRPPGSNRHVPVARCWPISPSASPALSH